MPGKPIPIREADNETLELRLMVDRAVADGQIDAAEARKIHAQVHLLEPLVHASYAGFRVVDSLIRHGEVSPQIHREFGPSDIVLLAESLIRLAGRLSNDTDPTDGAPQLRAA